MVSKTKTSQKNQASVTEEPETSGPTTRNKTRSPARTTSPGRPAGKSPSRAKSPTRKSPARFKNDASPPRTSTPKVETPKARSPIRRSGKSPTRLTKTTTRSVEIIKTQRVQRPRVTQIDVDIDSDAADGGVATAAPEKPQAAVQGRARRLESLEANVASTVRRLRSSQNTEIERVVHLQNFDSVAKKLGEFSDDDEVCSAKPERGADFKLRPEFGGTWGAFFLMLFTPIAIVVFVASCNELQCSFTKKPDLRKYILPSAYVDLFSILGFLIYAVILAALSVIPFGGKQVTGMPTKQGKFVYVINGVFSLFVLIAITLGLEYKKIRVIDFVHEHAFHLLIASILYGLFLASLAFVRSFYVPFSNLNAHVLGKNKIYGFFMGRELNPRIFRLVDLKIHVLRLSLIGCLLLDFVCLYRNLDWSTSSPLEAQTYFDFKSLNVNINPTLAVLLIIHSIYYLDGLIHENKFLSSLEILYEGFGYISGVGYLIYPFMMFPSTKYVADYNVRLPIWQLISIGVVFLFGYLLYRGSNNQKDAFRKNPYDPALTHLETIPTTKGKKLICSGFWGIVRHPNYLGDIIMNLAFVPFVLQVPPVLSPLSIVLFLIHRSVRDNARCKRKYGTAWERYCSKVKYVLIPKIY